MAENAAAAIAYWRGAPDPSWVATILARELGTPVRVRWLTRRPEFDMFAGDSAVGQLLVKVGPASRLQLEAANLRRAAAIVGELAPALVACVVPVEKTGVLAMARLPGEHVEPGRLWPVAWRRLSQGLLRLHAHPVASSRVCVPLQPDFITLGPLENRRVSLADFRSILSLQVASVPSLAAAPALMDALVQVVARSPGAFELHPRLVHADIWPQNVIVSGRRCGVIDWAWLKASDYALDLANLKLLLDYLCPSWMAQVMFEHLLRRYVHAFADAQLAARMAVYLPLVSLIHMVQYAEGDVHDPDNVAAMRACFAAACCNWALWTQPSLAKRVRYALGHPCQSEYAASAEPRASWYRRLAGDRQ